MKKFHPHKSMFLPSFWDSPEEDWVYPMEESALSIYEDEKKIYVEAALPGMNIEDIEITFDNDMLWIKGTRQEAEENKKKKFYRKASNIFSYRISLPAEVDEHQEPEAFYENGIMTISFHRKNSGKEPKKIQIRKK